MSQTLFVILVIAFFYVLFSLVILSIMKASKRGEQKYLELFEREGLANYGGEKVSYVREDQ